MTSKVEQRLQEIGVSIPMPQPQRRIICHLPALAILFSCQDRFLLLMAS